MTKIITDLELEIKLRWPCGDVVLDKNTKGEFLFMEESNGLQSYKLKNSPYYSLNSQKDDVPNIIAWKEFGLTEGNINARYVRHI